MTNAADANDDIVTGEASPTVEWRFDENPHIKA